MVNFAPTWNNKAYCPPDLRSCLTDCCIFPTRINRLITRSLYLGATNFLTDLFSRAGSGGTKAWANRVGTCAEQRFRTYRNKNFVFFVWWQHIHNCKLELPSSVHCSVSSPFICPSPNALLDFGRRSIHPCCWNVLTLIVIPAHVWLPTVPAASSCCFWREDWLTFPHWLVRS